MKTTKLTFYPGSTKVLVSYKNYRFRVPLKYVEQLIK